MSRKSFLITLAALLAVIIGLAVEDFCVADEKPVWDVSYPMANTRISWEQTYHAGAWNSEI